MKRRVILSLAGLGLLAGLSVPAVVPGPTCADVGFLGIEVHSQHIIRQRHRRGSLGLAACAGRGRSGDRGLRRGRPRWTGSRIPLPEAPPPARRSVSQANSPGSHEPAH